MHNKNFQSLSQNKEFLAAMDKISKASPEELEIAKKKLAAANALSAINNTLVVKSLVDKAKPVVLAHPEDQGIRLVCNVLSKMASNGTSIISKDDFKKICATYNQPRSFISQVFSSEIDYQELKDTRQAAGSKVENLHLDIYSKHANPQIANELQAMWDSKGKMSKSASKKSFDPTLEPEIKNVVSIKLASVNASPDSLYTFGGNDQVVICAAEYQTPRGRTAVMIPVELSTNANNKQVALIPTVIATQYGFADISKTNIAKQLEEVAGQTVVASVPELIEGYNWSKEFGAYSSEELELLAISKKASAANSQNINKTASASTAIPENKALMIMATDQIIGQEVEPANRGMLVMPEHKDTDSFAKKLSSAKGIAEFVFGSKVVEDGRNIINSKFASMGYRAQISVAGCDSNNDTHFNSGNITYAIKIDSGNGPVGCEAIAEVTNGKVAVPSILAVKDKAFDFSLQGVSDILRTQASDIKMLAAVSPMYEMGTHSIVEEIRKAADRGDYLAAEEALTVLSQKDQETYLKAFDDYMRSLSKTALNKQASTNAKPCGCSKLRKVANRLTPMCGHLNLPIDQVYQNDSGECCPLYRQHMSNTYEGVLFNTSKILG